MKSSACAVIALCALALVSVCDARPEHSRNWFGFDWSKIDWSKIDLSKIDWSIFEWWKTKNADQMAAEKVTFELYSNSTGDTPVVISAPFTDKSFQSLDRSRPIKVIVHGWHSSPFSHIRHVKDAFLQTTDYDLVLVNWRSFDTIIYPLAVKRIKPVARLVAHLIDSIVDSLGISTEDLHIIGHSLGAHIAGLAAKSVRRGRIGRVTGLDPAKPLIKHGAKERLHKSHAQFVDVIHTCGNVFGLRDPVGHVDFYPNGGRAIQPGCALEDLTSGKCSHNRSYYLFVETIYTNSSLLGVPAKPFPEGQWPCHEVDMDGEKVPMGLSTPTSARGVYCLPTRDSKPFGYGVDFSLHSNAPEPNERQAALMYRMFMSGTSDGEPHH